MVLGREYVGGGFRGLVLGFYFFVYIWFFDFLGENVFLEVLVRYGGVLVGFVYGVGSLAG